MAVGGVSAVGVGVGCWGVAIIVVVMLMMANWRCCEGVAGSGERARLKFACGTRRIVPRKARRGSGWPGWRWWAVGGGRWSGRSVNESKQQEREEQEMRACVLIDVTGRESLWREC